MLLAVALATIMLSSARADIDASTWDADVEYKLSLELPHSDHDVEELVDKVGRAWKQAEREVEFKPKGCRTVEFYDTPDGRLRASGLLIRLRVQRSKKKTCLDDSGEPLPTAGKWDASAKWTAGPNETRPTEATLEHETDWLAGESEERTRLVASKGVKREDGRPPEDFATILNTLALPETLAPKATNATPICRAPVEELRWEGEGSDREPTVTLWRRDGHFIAAEVSFDGHPSDLKLAERVRTELGERRLLTSKAESKTEAIYRACLGRH